jgi:hypothetical protein
MVVRGQRARTAVETERAQRSCQPRHFAKHFLRMPVLRQQNMPQRGQARIDGMQKPELRDLTGRHSRLKCSSSLLLLCDDAAFFFQNLHQPLQHL